LAQRYWGENLRGQDGTGALVGLTQPTGPRAIGQSEALDGIRLPGLVGFPGAAVVLIHKPGEDVWRV
jgi:hypothetical protein